MKTNNILKRVAIIATSTAIVFGSVMATPVKAEAKGTAFINKKVSSVTPTIKSAKRSKGKTTVTVSVPTSKVKKLGKAKKITVAYGSTKNSKKFEAEKLQAKVTKKGKNQYTFTVNNKDLASYKNAYITVRFDGKSNWSKLVKVSGKATISKKVTYWLRCCSCGKTWYSRTSMDELNKIFADHYGSQANEWEEKYGQYATSWEELCKLAEEHPICSSQCVTGQITSYSN